MNPSIQQAFHQAVQNNNLDTVRRMIAAGADVNLPDVNGCIPLVCAIVSLRDSEEMVSYLIRQGADVNWNKTDIYTPLGAAVSECADNYVKMLLEAGANPNLHVDTDDIPLIEAIGNHSKNIVRLLLEAGANPHVRDISGKTAMDYAVENKDQEIIDMLNKYTEKL